VLLYANLLLIRLLLPLQLLQCLSGVIIADILQVVRLTVWKSFANVVQTFGLWPGSPLIWPPDKSARIG
jgi:hypothetical protein